MLPSPEKVTLDLLIRDLKVFSDDPTSEMILNLTSERILYPKSEMELRIFFSLDFGEMVSPERLCRQTVTSKLSMNLSTFRRLVGRCSSVTEMMKWCSFQGLLSRW